MGGEGWGGGGEHEATRGLWVSRFGIYIMAAIHREERDGQ